MGSSITVRYGGHDVGSSVASYNLRYNHAAYNTGWSNWTTLTGRTATGTPLALSPGITYCVEVQSVDRAGNTSTWTGQSCTARPLDDRALTAGTGWNSGTGTSYYLHTYRSTSKYGATLTRTGAVFDRLAIVATRCATCGSVRIVVGGKTLATISLHAATTQRQWVYLLPKLTLRSATVKLVDATSGKPVQIDGLIVSRE
jgi:hypothetical protein